MTPSRRRGADTAAAAAGDFGVAGASSRRRSSSTPSSSSSLRGAVGGGGTRRSAAAFSAARIAIDAKHGHASNPSFIETATTIGVSSAPSVKPALRIATCVRDSAPPRVDHSVSKVIPLSVSPYTKPATASTSWSTRLRGRRVMRGSRAIASAHAPATTDKSAKSRFGGTRAWSFSRRRA